MRPPILRIHNEELIVDNFAGGGGASVGIKWALGRDPDIAINHNAEAIAMHRANHPSTKHYVCDVFEVDPLEACGLGRPWRDGDSYRVGLAWFSPDCTFHSKARGSKPFRDRNKARRRRGLAGVVLKWAAQVRPRLIALENVEEFEDWGPLNDDGTINELLRGFSFRRWVQRLRNLGYVVEWRQLRACDFGAPTTRKRLFILAKHKGDPTPIAWPEPTHGPAPRPLPYRTAAECIDWSIPSPSIFMTKAEAKEWKRRTGKDVRRPLSGKTMRRLAAGVIKKVLKNPRPFIMPVNHGVSKFDGDGLGRSRSVDEPLGTVTAAPRGEFAVVAPVLVQTSWGEREGQRPRYLDIHKPLGTIMADGIKHSVAEVRLERAELVASFLAKPSQELTAPAPTICANGNHIAEVCAFLIAYYGTDQDPRIDEPMPTLTTKHRMALVTVVINGVTYAVVDITMRMLEPPELFQAQGFPQGYVIDPVVEVRQIRGRGAKRREVVVRKPLSKTSQVHMCGNSVSPPNAEALLIPNYAVCDAEMDEVANG